MKRNNLTRAILLSTLFLTLVACATQPESSGSDLPGFFLGLFHGFTIVFAFIGSFFFVVDIYAFPNAGWPYNLGYVIGAASFLGGSGSTVR